MKKMTADDRLIVALDVNDFEKLVAVTEKLGDGVSFYKVGMELYYSAGNDAISYLHEKGKLIFLDLKLHDIPNTVAQAVAAVTHLGVNFITVHAQGGRAMMEAAVKSAKVTAEALGIPAPKILAVTVLTALDDAAWEETGGRLPIAGEVLRLAKLAKESGVSGVVASPLEAKMLRDALGDDFEIVTPGIRPAFAAVGDQKRIATPASALASGASRLVIGRPITQAEDSQKALELILKEMKEIHHE